MAKKKDKLTSAKIIQSFAKARKYSLKWHENARKDFEYRFGKQWDDKKKAELEKAGVPPLTINKIQPYIHLITGIQRQNRTDYIALPEGDEDSLAGEISTRLLKNVMKQSNAEQVISEMFEDACICGRGFIEPYMDYTYNLLTGKMEWAKGSPFEIFVDPASKKYDLSDAEYVCKLKTKLTKGQLMQIFPGKEKDIDRIGEAGRLNIDKFSGKEVGDKYENEDAQKDEDDWLNAEPLYDLLEHHYKKYVTKVFVADKDLGEIKEVANRKEAEDYEDYIVSKKQEELGARNEKIMNGELEGEEAVEWDDTMNPVGIIEQTIPEIWVASQIGNSEKPLENKKAWSYPRHPGYPIFPLYAYRTTVELRDKEYMNYGIVRMMVSPQDEVNKRRTQELRHLNSSVHSGWIEHQNAWTNPDDVKKFGSSPGVNLIWKGNVKPEQILPTPLSQGHHLLAAESTNDMKEISGINVEALALSDKASQSGRAIMLRQKQGMTMVQVLFDNLSYTKKSIGKFILSQLGEVYTVETAVRVLGDAFIQDNFARPVMGQDGITPELDNGGEIVKEVNPEEVGAIINQVLKDSELGKYDVTIGEGSHSETVKYANAMLLMEMAEKGIPIPPDILVDESLLSEASKTKIKEAIRKAQEAAATQGAV